MVSLADRPPYLPLPMRFSTLPSRKWKSCPYLSEAGNKEILSLLRFLQPHNIFGAPHPNPNSRSSFPAALHPLLASHTPPRHHHRLAAIVAFPATGPQCQTSSQLFDAYPAPPTLDCCRPTTVQPLLPCCRRHCSHPHAIGFVVVRPSPASSFTMVIPLLPSALPPPLCKSPDEVGKEVKDVIFL
jgi:hypothetical protein